MNIYLINDIYGYLHKHIRYLHEQNYSKVHDEYRKKIHVVNKCMDFLCHQCSRYYDGLEEKPCDAPFSRLSYEPYENDDFRSYDFNYRSIMMYHCLSNFLDRYRSIKNIFDYDYNQLPENYWYTYPDNKSLLKVTREF